MDDQELEKLLETGESDRVELKASLADRGKICQAICAFANDLPGHGEPGVLFVGVQDDGSCAELPIDDRLLQSLAAMRDDGKIQPLPTMTVAKKTLGGCEMAVVTVQPALAPPVRYEGRIWIRVGPRRAVASADEERRLTERKRATDLPFELQPCSSTTLDDLDLQLFERVYLPAAIAPDILRQNSRTLAEQLRALRFIDREGIPTVLGMLVLGNEPLEAIPGAYVQFVRFDGTEMTDPIRNQKIVSGPLSELLTRFDEVLEANIETATSITEGPLEIRHPDYPLAALQQLTRNAVMHRNYEGTNAPVRCYWFTDRLEIHNPGGPYGQVTPENIGHPHATDYRNRYLAEAMHALGFVQRFGIGISIARGELEKNGNPPLEIDAQASSVLLTIRRAS